MTLLPREKKLVDGTTDIFARYVFDVSGTSGIAFSADNYAKLIANHPPTALLENELATVVNSTDPYLLTLITLWKPTQYKFPSGIYICREDPDNPGTYIWDIFQKQSEQSFVSNVLKNISTAEWATLVSSGQQIPQYAIIKYNNVLYDHLTAVVTATTPDQDSN